MDVETTQQESQDTTSAEEATRDDLIAAAREAMGAEAPVAPETGSEATTEQAPQADDPTEKINSVLRAREEAHRKRLEAENHASTLRQQAEEEAKRIREEARAEAKRIADEELAALRAKYRESPTAALRALADNPQDVVDAVLREGTPEARALAKLQEEARQAKEAALEGKTAKAELEKFKADLAREKQEQIISQVRTDFLTNHASAEKAPYMHARWDPEEVFARCDALCRDWENDGLKLGIDFDQGTLVAYLEKQSRERFSKLQGTPAQQSGAGAATRQPGIAPKSAANGTRTITAASSSERRASPKPFNELSPEEQREDLIRVAQEAFRQHGKT